MRYRFEDDIVYDDQDGSLCLQVFDLQRGQRTSQRTRKMAKAVCQMLNTQHAEAERAKMVNEAHPE